MSSVVGVKGVSKIPLSLEDVGMHLKSIVFRNYQLIYDPNYMMHLRSMQYGDTVIDEHGQRLDPRGGRLIIRRPIAYREFDRMRHTDSYRSVEQWIAEDEMDKNYSLEQDLMYGYSGLRGRDIAHVDYLEGMFYPPEFFSKEELFEFIMRRLILMDGHECQENFYVDGVRIFDPHIYGEFFPLWQR